MTKDEIIKLSDKELRIKAAELNGEKIVCEEWPCGHPPDTCGLHAADFVIKEGDKWTTDTPEWYGTPWPVVLNDRKWMLATWPPIYNEESKDWEVDVRPIKDYPNDIEAALGLWEQIPGIKEIWWNDEGKISIQLSWDKCENTRPSHLEYAHWVEGKPEELPRLLTQAFIIYKESDNNGQKQ